MIKLLAKNKVFENGSNIPELTVVLVWTECGMKYYKAHLEKKSSICISDSAYGYFITFLHSLVESADCNMYKRVLIVQFESSCATLSESPELPMNRLKRYTMPNHFNLLIQALTR